jgi:TetR/AcrR family transcriptional regulator, regulator of cefoperazone and chloramphenicol sensitivity
LIRPGAGTNPRQLCSHDDLDIFALQSPRRTCVVRSTELLLQVVAHARLLDVAIREFGTHGLDGASTRGIAAAAGTAMSAITYHYGGKEGLYLAAADHIASEMFDASTQAIVDEARTAGDAAGARAGIHAIIGHFVERLLEPDDNEWSLFIMREQTSPTAAFHRIYEGAMGRIFEPLIDLVCLATGKRDPCQARLVVIALVGQVLVLKSGQAMCRRLLAGLSPEPDLTTAYSARVAANCDAILDRLIAEQGDQA